MKPLIRFLFIAVFTSLLFACSKSSQFDDEIAGVEMKSAAGISGQAHKAAPVTEIIIPVGLPNGVDDTDALMAAFTAAAAPGVKNPLVQMEEGIYHLNFIEIREFSGKFRGAGKGKTVITTVSDLSVDAMISRKLNTVLIRFVGGDVCMSNMTLMTPPGPLSTGTENYIDGLAGFSARTYEYTSKNDYIKAVIDHIDFSGNWENVNNGLKAEFGVRGNVRLTGGWPLSCMDISITNCSFDGFYNGASLQHFKGGKIIAGTLNNGNMFSNNTPNIITGYETGVGGSLVLWSNVNVEISIEGNSFDVPVGNRWGIEIFSSPVPARLQQVSQTSATICHIEKNIFNVTGGVGGILINDRRRFFFPEELPMMVQVKNNRFNCSNDAFAGLSTCNSFGMVIRNNKFAGSGQYGVRVMGPITAGSGQNGLPPNENGLMLGNNFSNATFSVASVLLDTRTNDWTIVGGNLGETLIDLTNGAGGHLITGMNVNTSDVPLGQTITDNLKEIRPGREQEFD